MGSDLHFWMFVYNFATKRRKIDLKRREKLVKDLKKKKSWKENSFNKNKSCDPVVINMAFGPVVPENAWIDWFYWG